MKTVIALDIGTTHIKSILFDQEGRVVRQEKCTTPLEKDRDGCVYHAEAFWGIIKNQIDTLYDYGEGQLLGISITGMAEAGLIVDRDTGEALTDILPWFDQRPLSLAEKMPEEEAERVFKTTGLRNSFKYGVYKFLWLLNEQNIDPESVVWMSVCDYTAYRLTGNIATDPTFAARTYVYDVICRCWDEERIRGYGLQTENFPKVEESGKAVGEYRGVPVAIAGHDHLCAAFGILYHCPDTICDSAGTSETYMGILPKDGKTDTDGFQEKSGLLYGPFIDDGYFFMGNVPSSGHSIEWYRKSLQLQELSYEEMNQALLLVERGPGGLLYFPYLTGMGAPWYRADMKSALFGMTENHDGIRVLKGMIEGIQYQAKWLLMLLEQYHGIRRAAVTCAGGAVHNQAMMQMKADILNMIVKIPEVTEATLCGAAALFLKKNQGDVERFLAGSGFICKEYEPDPVYCCAYETVFREGYLPVAGALSNIGHRALKP